MEKSLYRLDIEGLRAIAILGVVIFHVSAFHLPGGFVGVDIFFVISGYLITDHIWRDLKLGRFSLVNFYLKRIRRLYPALFAMLAITSLAVYKIYLPVDTAQFGSSLLASTIYASNFFFYTQSDYFNSDLEISPLLHTWSLSVEEQFYLIFPFLMIFLFKKSNKNIFLIVLTIAIISFSVSQIELSIDPSASFFISPFRFWQLLAGSLIIFIPRPDFTKKQIPNLLSAIGFSAIIFSMFAFSGKTPFPGLYALIPTIGTVLIIYAGQQNGNIISKFLSIAPARFFGKISYSLYLWHWPLLAIYRYRISATLNPIEKIALFFACIAIGYLSHQAFEKTTKTISLEKPTIKWVAAIASALGILAGLIMMNGAPNRYSEEVQRLSKITEYNQVSNSKPHDCYLSFQNKSADEFDYNSCVPPKGSQHNILIMGDSHAYHLIHALKEKYSEDNFSLAIASGCRPVIGGQGDKRCTDFRDRIFNEFIPKWQYDTIILSGRWNANDASNLQKTVTQIAPYAKSIVISGPIIEYSVPLPRLLAFSSNEDDNGKLVNIARLTEKIKSVDILMRNSVNGTSAKYFSTYDALCPNGHCVTVTNGNVPVQWDYGHLTEEGARLIVRAMDQAHIF